MLRETLDCNVPGPMVKGKPLPALCRASQQPRNTGLDFIDAGFWIFLPMYPPVCSFIVDVHTNHSGNRGPDAHGRMQCCNVVQCKAMYGHGMK